MEGITTHVLDVSRGRPAAGIHVRLEQRKAGDEWQLVGSGQTNGDGRVSNLLPFGTMVSPGQYRLTFDTRQYFAASATATLYPSISIVFEAAAEQSHYHVPLLLSPFGYTTYRGS
jgi:5-hydroxyisourate hydrolase